MGFKSMMPGAVADYGDRHPESDWTQHPIIVQVFTPGRGWQRHPGNKRVTASYVRTLKREGVTAVGVSDRPGRCVDFKVSEILSGRQRSSAAAWEESR